MAETVIVRWGCILIPSRQAGIWLIVFFLFLWSWFFQVIIIRLFIQRFIWQVTVSAAVTCSAFLWQLTGFWMWLWILFPRQDAADGPIFVKQAVTFLSNVRPVLCFWTLLSVVSFFFQICIACWQIVSSDFNLVRIIVSCSWLDSALFRVIIFTTERSFSWAVFCPLLYVGSAWWRHKYGHIRGLFAVHVLGLPPMMLRCTNTLAYRGIVILPFRIACFFTKFCVIETITLFLVLVESPLVLGGGPWKFHPSLVNAAAFPRDHLCD